MKSGRKFRTMRILAEHRHEIGTDRIIADYTFPGEPNLEGRDANLNLQIATEAEYPGFLRSHASFLANLDSSEANYKVYGIEFGSCRAMLVFGSVVLTVVVGISLLASVQIPKGDTVVRVQGSQ